MWNMTILEPIKDYEKVFNTLVNQTVFYLQENNLHSMVLGISGGIDSTVCAAICYEVYKQTGIPLIGRSIPIKNKADEFNISRRVGNAFCNDFCDCNLYDLYYSISARFKELEYNHSIKIQGDTMNYGTTPISEGNIQARLRMIYLYNLASINKGLVIDTDNLSEYYLGFWTIHGDEGDFNPIGGLWKTEVYKLADYLMSDKYCLDEDKMNAIKNSFDLIPTDGLGISNSDLDQIGARSYQEADFIIKEYLEYCDRYITQTSLFYFLEETKIPVYTDITLDTVKRVLTRVVNSEFKRKKRPIVIDRGTYV